MTTGQNTTVWASFIYLRSGENTPSALQGTPAQLTSLGASELQSAGQFFRNLYLQDSSSSRIAALDAFQPLAAEVSALTLADTVTLGSTQAFMLGMWPPNATVTTTATDISSSLANGTTLTNPLGGIRFPVISAVSQNDIESIYVGGDVSCNGFSTFTQQINPAASLVQVEQESRAVYTSVQNILNPVFTQSEQTFDNAKNIYDYVNYQNLHNKTAAAQLSNQPNVLTNLRYYATLQQIALYGDTDAGNPYDRAPLAAKVGSISTIAGGSLASQIGIALYAQSYSVRSAHPLNIVVGDHGPLTSLFPLLNITSNSPTGLALPGSAAVFELISSSSTSSRTENGIPSPSDLSVRFRFRNGTGLDGISGSGGDLLTIPLFGQSSPSMPYTTFLSSLQSIAITSPQDWCYQCGATSLFCAAWNTTDALLPSTSSSTHISSVSPATAGAIGAITTLLLLFLLSLVAFLLGLRPTRTAPIWRRPRSRHSLGGFKGSAKLASDPDLTAFAPPSYPIIGATVEKPSPVLSSPSSSPHSRNSSWEMADSPSPPSRENAFSFACAGVGGQKRFVRDSQAGSFVERDMGGLGGLDGARMGWGSREDVSRWSRWGGRERKGSAVGGRF
ncbi:phosphoglycerate mutase-like protein [Myriangium duriaei CBS 260.36]|uniref:Phosphoglycerate mutase-like protein n=1 Tax=Myriangium duriaei CBS 260.36 TaxID=1168546 RepID=A0A9P4MGS8_9PEZI|nr:phosphoglycerate mutase-like protein [Myriangium duriaei CBS 260.36]